MDPIYITITILMAAILIMILWYLWWGDRRPIEDCLIYLCAFIGIGYRDSYKASVVVLIIGVSFFYYGPWRP